MQREERRRMNKVILMGRLTRQPEVRYSQGAEPMAIARFTLAVDRRMRKQEAQQQGQQTADFISCVAFGRLGEFAEKHLNQGTRIVLEGHITTGSYTNREGQKVYTTEVTAEGIEFAESKASEQRGQQDAGDGFMSIPDGCDDGLPFN